MKKKTSITATDFLRDVIPLIKENLQQAKENPTDDFNKGLVFAYFDVLSILQTQAQIFDINLEEIKLKYELTDELIYSKIAI